MELLATANGRRVWIGRVERPDSFRSPAEGEYALLLVIAEEGISAQEQADLSKEIVRSGCRWAVCFGAESESWDDSIDWVNVGDEIEGKSPNFVMTTWHDHEPLAETVEFFASQTSFDDFVARDFVVLVLGGPAQLHEEVRETVRRLF